MARPGVVGRDPRRVRQAGAQHGAGFVLETLLAGDQQADDLPLGDEDAEPLQHRDQSRRRDLSLMVLGEHEAAQFRSEMTIDAWRQGRHHRLAVRGLPAFPVKVGDKRADQQILNQEARIAFETRAGRRIGRELALLMDRQFRARAAAPPALARRVRRLRFASLFHAARLDIRLDVRPTRPALQPRDLVTQRPNRSPKFRLLLEKLKHQALELGRRKRVDVRRRRHSDIESENRQFGNPPSSTLSQFAAPTAERQSGARQDFCPCYAAEDHFSLLRISRADLRPETRALGSRQDGQDAERQKEA